MSTVVSFLATCKTPSPNFTASAARVCGDTVATNTDGLTMGSGAAAVADASAASDAAAGDATLPVPASTE